MLIREDVEDLANSDAGRQAMLRDQINQGEVLASLGLTSLCYVMTYEIFLAGEARAVFLFVV